MTATRTALTVLLAILLATIATPAQAHTTAITGESPAHTAQVEPGKLLLTLIIVQPGTVESYATDSTPTTETPTTETPATTETPTTELTPECPGQYSTPGPHPCPQTNRAGIDNANGNAIAPIPNPEPEPARNNH